MLVTFFNIFARVVFCLFLLVLAIGVVSLQLEKGKRDDRKTIEK